MSNKINGYKFDITTQTLTITTSFADAMNDPTSKEYALVCQFRHDFRNLRIVRKTHATPTKYHNRGGIITTRNKHHRLTYKFMENYMLALPNGEEYLENYFELREKAEAMCASPYSVVSEWFVKVFPEYRTNPLHYLDGEPVIIDFSEILGKAKKKGEKNEKPAV